MAAAAGEYLAFADAGDRFTAGGLSALVASLETSGSQLAVGVVAPPRESGRMPAWAVRPRPAPPPATGVTADGCPSALGVLSLAGKVFRLPWWQSSGFRVSSWAGAADAVAESFLEADAFDVVPERVYELHRRDGSLPLRQQRRYRADLAVERCAGLRRAALVLSRLARQSYESWLVDLFDHELPLRYVDAVGGGAAYFGSLQPLVSSLLADLPTDVTDRLRLEARMAAWVAAHGTLEDLAVLLGYLASNPTGLPVSSGVARLPSGLDLAHEWRRLGRGDLRPRVHLGEMVRTGKGGSLTGIAFTEYVEPSSVPRVRLVGGTAALVERRADPRANLWAGRAFEDRTNAGFVATWEQLTPADRSEWQVEVTVDADSERHTVRERVEQTQSAVVLTAELAGARLLLGGRTARALGEMRVDLAQGGTFTAAVEQDGEVWAADVPLVVCTFGRHTLLPSGRHTLVLRDSRGDPMSLGLSADLLDDSPDLVAERLSVRLEAGGGRCFVVVDSPLTADERSAFRQRSWQASVYAGPPRATYDDVVLLETFGGRTAGDSPGAIGGELIARDLGLDLVWVVDDSSVVLPAGSRPVSRRTREWYNLLNRARTYISNAGAPAFFEKKPGQVHLQTWHGTPLKRIGEDRGPGDFATWRHRRSVARQAAGWDAMVSPSPYCSAIYRSAFRFGGECLELGYPRNDALLAPEAASARQRTRDVLGLHIGDVAVLYAPTWREYLDVRDAKPLYLHVDRFTRRLRDAVVLVRGHYNATGQKDVYVDHPRVRDVTRYPDINDLYLASDALVTDYSSIMFDYALTDKPIVLLTPDLEHYRDVERGFYLDFPAESPGPVVESTREVVAALTAPDRHAGQRARFREQFCPYEDGRASARVVEWLLSQWR